MPNLPYSKRSFECHRCPRDGSADKSAGCPSWVSYSDGVAALDHETREEKFVEGCGHRLTISILRNLTRATYNHAAASESGRDTALVEIRTIHTGIAEVIRQELPNAMLAVARQMQAAQVIARLHGAGAGADEVTPELTP